MFIVATFAVVVPLISTAVNAVSLPDVPAATTKSNSPGLVSVTFNSVTPDFKRAVVDVSSTFESVPNFNSAFAAVRSNLPSSVLVPDPSPVSVVLPVADFNSVFI